MRRDIIVGLILLVVVGAAAYAFLADKAEPPPTAKEEAHHDDEKGSVALTAEQIAKGGIKVEVAGPATIRETLPLYGVVALNAERVRDVAARFPGSIRRLDKKVGDTVKQGETLAIVESNESLQAYPVTAPLAGIVTARNANQGEQSGDKVLFTIADLSAVWVELSLFPRDATKVREGQKVIVRGADAGAVGNGDLVFVAPLGNASSQTRTARVLLDNTDRSWAPGLYVSAEVILGESTAPIAVKSSALQDIEGSETVFVRNAEGFEVRAVKVGRSDGENTEILSGLQSGESYASDNSFVVKAEIGKGEAAHVD